MWRECARNGVILQPDVRIGFNNYTLALLAAGVLDIPTHKRLDRLFSTGSKATHGNRVGVDTIQNQLVCTKVGCRIV